MRADVGRQPSWHTRRRDHVRVVRQRYAAEHPERRRALHAVERALGAGLLTRGPCEVCGAERAEAHHEDYGRPLEVRWLCRRRHAQRHAEMRRAAAR